MQRQGLGSLHGWCCCAVAVLVVAAYLLVFRSRDGRALLAFAFPHDVDDGWDGRKACSILWFKIGNGGIARDISSRQTILATLVTSLLRIIISSI